MKEKLTKNVSIQSEMMDTEVIIAAFEALLSRNALLTDYYAEWAKRRILNYGDTIRQQFCAWADKVVPENWILSAFDLSNSHIPARVWYNMYDKWYNWCKQNNVQKPISDLKCKK